MAFQALPPAKQAAGPRLCTSQPLKSLLPRGTPGFPPTWSLPCQSVCLCQVNAGLFTPCQAKQVGPQGVKCPHWPAAEFVCSPLRMLFTKKTRKEGEQMQRRLCNVCHRLHLLPEATGRPQECGRFLSSLAVTPANATMGAGISQMGVHLPGELGKHPSVELQPSPLLYLSVFLSPMDYFP